MAAHPLPRAPLERVNLTPSQNGAFGRLFFIFMLLFRFSGRLPCLLVFLFGLSGCASGSSSVVDIFSSVLGDKFGISQKQTLGVTTNPAYRYLRVQAEGSAPAFLVLGYVDAHPQGDIEVWYSSKKEVIKTQNGRIVGTAGLEVDWHGVQYL